MSEVEAKRSWVVDKLDKAFLTPMRAMRLRYVPLLMVYLAYGASSISGTSMQFWVKENLTLTAVQLASIGIWVTMPWTIKMIFGQMIDSLPIFGSRRKAYIFLGAGVTALGAVTLAGMAGGHWWVTWIGSEMATYMVAMVFTTTGFVIQDVTADAMTTEVVPREGRPEKNIKSDLAMVQVLGRLALSFGMVAVAKLSGYIAGLVKTSSYVTYERIFWGLLIIPVISCLGAIFVRLEKGKEEDPSEAKGGLNPRILGGGIFLGGLSVSIGFLKIKGVESLKMLLPYTDEIVFVVTLAVLLWMIHSIIRHMEPERYKVLLFTMIAIFLYRCSPQVGAGLTWWVIDVLGFDENFFGTLAQIATTVPLIVLWLFAEFIAKRPIRSVLIFLIILGAVMTLPEVLLYYGGPSVQEHAKYVVIFDTALESPLVQISMVPMLALIAFYAPARARGTWFAVGASFMNLGLMGANLLTKYLNIAFKVRRALPDGAGGMVPANYSKLGLLIIAKIVVSFVVPAVAILVFLRKPKKEGPLPISGSPEEPGPDLTESADGPDTTPWD